MKRNGMGMGRRSATALGVVALLLAAVGCGTRAAPVPADEASAGVPVEAWYDEADIPEKLMPDGTTILVGDPAAPVTLHVYEDARCPYCAEFETAGAGPDIRQMVRAREVRVEYTLASFLDRDGGDGSKNTVNALRAALEQDKFVELHEQVFLFQPTEASDGFTDDYLLGLADQVDGLRGKAFDTAVRDMKYADFVADSQRAYDADGAPGTPSMKIDGEWLPEDYAGILHEPGLFSSFLDLFREDPDFLDDPALLG